jgi:hypothetical protein
VSGGGGIARGVLECWSVGVLESLAWRPFNLARARYRPCVRRSVWAERVGVLPAEVGSDCSTSHLRTYFCATIASRPFSISNPKDRVLFIYGTHIHVPCEKGDPFVLEFPGLKPWAGSYSPCGASNPADTPTRFSRRRYVSSATVSLPRSGGSFPSLPRLTGAPFQGNRRVSSRFGARQRCGR